MALTHSRSPWAQTQARPTTRIATTIAAKSPLSIRGIKEMLNYARDHTVADGLNHVATWNAANHPRTPTTARTSGRTCATPGRRWPAPSPTSP